MMVLSGMVCLANTPLPWMGESLTSMRSVEERPLGRSGYTAAM